MNRRQPPRARTPTEVKRQRETPRRVRRRSISLETMPDPGVDPRRRPPELRFGSSSSKRKMGIDDKASCASPGAEDERPRYRQGDRYPPSPSPQTPAPTPLSHLIKAVAFEDVFGGIIQDNDLHCVASRSRFFTVSQSRNRDSPRSMRFARSLSTRPCHSGIGMGSPEPQTSSQIASMRRNLSATESPARRSFCVMTKG